MNITSDQMSIAERISKIAMAWLLLLFLLGFVALFSLAFLYFVIEGRSVAASSISGGIDAFFLFGFHKMIAYLFPKQSAGTPSKGDIANLPPLSSISLERVEAKQLPPDT